MPSSPLRIAVQMDPPHTINLDTDSSFALMEDAQARGFALWSYQPEHLAFIDGRVQALARPTQVSRTHTPVTLGEAQWLDLGRDTDIVLMRQDPPLDESYLSAAYMLELIQGETLVCNDPKGVRDSPEKVLPLRFPDLMPPTLISRDMAQLARFRSQQGDIVLKPLHGHGGRHVFRVTPDDGNFAALVEMFCGLSPAPMIAQAFLPDVADGDKRILLIDGEPCGAINRRPETGSIRSNMAVGGEAQAANLSKRDQEICARIGPELRQRGLWLVGIDVIGAYMTEINVTSPTGLQGVRRLCPEDPVAQFWDVITARL